MAAETNDDLAYRERNNPSHQQTHTLLHGLGRQSRSHHERQQDGEVQEFPAIGGRVSDRNAVEQDAAGEGDDPPRNKAGRPDGSDPRDSPLTSADDLPPVPVEAGGEREYRAILYAETTVQLSRQVDHWHAVHDHEDHQGDKRSRPPPCDHQGSDRRATGNHHILMTSGYQPAADKCPD